MTKCQPNHPRPIILHLVFEKKFLLLQNQCSQNALGLLQANVAFSSLWNCFEGHNLTFLHISVWFLLLMQLWCTIRFSVTLLYRSITYCYSKCYECYGIVQYKGVNSVTEWNCLPYVYYGPSAIPFTGAPPFSMACFLPRSNTSCIPFLKHQKL